MIKTFCDICSREMKKEDLIWVRFFKAYGHNEEFNKTAETMDICPECYKKIAASKVPDPEVTTPILKQAEKIVKDAVKETPKKEKPKKEAPDPEKKTRNDNIDDGKIWALAHAKKPWTIEAIAEECRCSTATVYNHLKRMREERGEY